MKPDIPHKTFGIANRYLLLCIIIVIGIATIGNGTLSTVIADNFVGNGVYPVEAYGAIGDGSTDDTTAIRAAVSALSANGGGTLKFTSGKTYKVTGLLETTGYATNPMFLFQNLKGVTIDGAGATIRDARIYTGTYPNGDNSTMFVFQNTSHININIATDGYYGGSDRVGYDAFVFKNGSYDINADVTVNGSVRAFYMYRLTTDPQTYAVHDVNGKLIINNSEYGCFADRGHYNINCQSKLNHVARGFFLIGVQNVKINQYETNPDGANEIGVYGGANSSDIDINLVDVNSTIAGVSNFLVALQYTDQTPGELKNIKIKLDTKSPAAAPWHDTIRIRKLNNAGGNDFVGRGHVLSGLDISGYDYQTSARDHIVSDGGFTSPDIIKGVNIHDMVLDSTDASGSDVLLNLTGLVGYAKVQNVYAPKAEIQITNPAGTGYWVNYYNVYARAASPGESVAETNAHEYVFSNLTVAGAQSVHNKVIFNTAIGGTYYNNLQTNVVNPVTP